MACSHCCTCCIQYTITTYIDDVFVSYEEGILCCVDYADIEAESITVNGPDVVVTAKLAINNTTVEPNSIVVSGPAVVVTGYSVINNTTVEPNSIVVSGPAVTVSGYSVIRNTTITPNSITTNGTDVSNNFFSGIPLPPPNGTNINYSFSSGGTPGTITNWNGSTGSTTVCSGTVNMILSYSGGAWTLNFNDGTDHYMTYLSVPHTVSFSIDTTVDCIGPVLVSIVFSW